MSSERIKELCDLIAFVLLLLIVSTTVFVGNLQYYAELYDLTYYPRAYATPSGVMP